MIAGGVAGFVAAASPAAFQTFTGSIRLAAGEIGMTLIPAIVDVSRFFQGLAGTLRNFNSVTGGIVGSILQAAALPVMLIALSGGVVVATKAIYGMVQAAYQATVALGSRFAGGATIGSLASPSGRGFGLALGLGLGASTVGSMVGGNAGGYLSAMGAGASIGSFGFAIHPIVGAITTGVGALVGAIVHGFSKAMPPAASFNFQSQTSSIEDMHDIVQREALRDPMQQAQAEQQARATEELARQVGYLSRAILGTNAGWQAGN